LSVLSTRSAGATIPAVLGNGCSNLGYPQPVQARSGVGAVLLNPKASRGDANLDQATTSVDAQLVLQFDAALISVLVCPTSADFNTDNRLNAIDASLILQRSAGLI
jgi:hypothetical protein